METPHETEVVLNDVSKCDLGYKAQEVKGSIVKKYWRISNRLVSSLVLRLFCMVIYLKPIQLVHTDFCICFQQIYEVVLFSTYKMYAASR